MSAVMRCGGLFGRHTCAECGEQIVEKHGCGFFLGWLLLLVMVMASLVTAVWLASAAYQVIDDRISVLEQRYDAHVRKDHR